MAARNSSQDQFDRQRYPTSWSDEGSAEPLSREEASATIDQLWKQFKREQFPVRKAELAKSSLTFGGHTLHWQECTYGDEEPSEGRSLWISMHGGGSCTAADNDEQYQNQLTLYDPTEGIWVVPRSPTDDWNQWHQEHIDQMFDRIIENYIIAKNVNPDRVYILGYSAGGDGVYQLAPRMSDRFAAAAMMAGHPNNASPLGLRNLPFAIFVGEKDSEYDRNDIARQWAERLDALEAAEPGAYQHYVNICAEMGHWMCGRDAEALPWMAQWTRQPWPKKIVWVQGNVTHDRLYWLSIPDRNDAEPGQTITAEVDEQAIKISASDTVHRLTLRLSDALLDLDQPINVHIEGFGEVFQGEVPRTELAIRDSFRRRADPSTAATALIDLFWENVWDGLDACRLRVCMLFKIELRTPERVCV